MYYFDCSRFLHYQKSYNPPGDVCKRIDKICEDQSISVDDETRVHDPVQRFHLFLACERELEHSIPNSTLYEIETIRKDSKIINYDFILYNTSFYTVSN